MTFTKTTLYIWRNSFNSEVKKYDRLHYELSPWVRFEPMNSIGERSQTAHHHYVQNINYYMTSALKHINIC